jgi:molybdate transport system permease protein
LGADVLDLGTYILDAVVVTTQVASVATLAMAPVGILLGYLLARVSFRGRSLVQTLVSLPMVLPPVAVGLMLLMFLGRLGPAGSVLHNWFGVDLVFTWVAAAVAAAVMSFPLVVRSAEAAFAEVPIRLEQVARTLGASRARVFFTVTVPLARRGILYGVVLGFSRSLGEFGATILVAGNLPGETTTVAVGIFSLVEAGRDGDALVLIAVSVAMALVSVLAAELWLKERR